MAPIASQSTQPTTKFTRKNGLLKIIASPFPAQRMTYLLSLLSFFPEAAPIMTITDRCEIGLLLVFNGRVAEPEAEAGQKRGDRLRPESSAPGFGADAVSQNGRSFGLRLERHRSLVCYSVGVRG